MCVASCGAASGTVWRVASCGVASGTVWRVERCERDRVASGSGVRVRGREGWRVWQEVWLRPATHSAPRPCRAHAGTRDSPCDLYPKSTTQMLLQFHPSSPTKGATTATRHRTCNHATSQMTNCTCDSRPRSPPRATVRSPRHTASFSSRALLLPEAGQCYVQLPVQLGPSETGDGNTS